MAQSAVEIIQQYQAEEAKVAPFRSLYQDAADYMFPRSDQITRKHDAEPRSQKIVDTTAVTASLEMASGLSQNLVAPGQKFFALRASDRAMNEQDEIKRYLSHASDMVHEHLFSSNFMLQLNETLRSLCVFGTGCLYSEFLGELNFIDYDISSYVIMENAKQRVDTIMLKFPYTARQAYQVWGENAGQKVSECMADLKKQEEKFDFLHVVRPRENRNPNLTDNLNMSFESLYINIKEKTKVAEGGYREFPYHVPRWTKASCEVFGRGQGTFILPDVRVLQTMKRDFIECANKWNNPPLEVSEKFEGPVRVTPGALNYVRELGSIRAIQQNAMGNFAITKDALEMQQDLVRKAFYNDIFVQLANLKGDRRTTLEIRERIGEGLQRLGPPIGRIQEELFSPLIARVVSLLMANGQMDVPPPAMAQNPQYKIEYVGRLALELKSQQARGVQEWMGWIGQMEPMFPGISDNIDVDSSARRLGETLGVNADDIASTEEVAAKRQARAEQMQAQQQAQMLAMAAQGYNQTNKAPEAGSPAEMVMGGGR